MTHYAARGCALINGPLHLYTGRKNIRVRVNVSSVGVYRKNWGKEKKNKREAEKFCF